MDDSGLSLYTDSTFFSKQSRVCHWLQQFSAITAFAIIFFFLSIAACTCFEDLS